MHRYISTGTGCARFWIAGKKIRWSLRTTDCTLAKRRLAARRDALTRANLAGSRYSLAEMSGRYLATIQHQEGKTVRRKTHHPPRGRKAAVTCGQPSVCRLAAGPRRSNDHGFIPKLTGHLAHAPAAAHQGHGLRLERAFVTPTARTVG